MSNPFVTNENPVVLVEKMDSNDAANMVSGIFIHLVMEKAQVFCRDDHSEKAPADSDERWKKGGRAYLGVAWNLLTSNMSNPTRAKLDASKDRVLDALWRGVPG